MTTTLAKKKSKAKGKKKPTPSQLSLHVADWSEMIGMLKENYEIWGAGLSREKYYDWTSRQLQTSWARRNYRYIIAKLDDVAVASCKLYTLFVESRGRSYKICGVGAVYTPKAKRGLGHAGRMLKAVEQQCRAESYDGIWLFSDIDPEFYEKLGYELFPNCEFHIWLNDPAVEAAIMSDPNFAEDMQEYEPDLATLEVAEVPNIEGHYRRCVRSRKFGVVRTSEYWQYKIEREQFLQNHSSDNWPTLELMTLDAGGGKRGYAVFEQGGKALRVLEVVGSQETQAALWRHLLRTALLRRVQLVRGWEGIAPDFVKSLCYVERTWGHPMMLFINPEIESWLDQVPCPLFELDHF